MKNYITLNKRKSIRKVAEIIQKLELHTTLKNKRTTIWENNDIQISIDHTIVRICIFDIDNLQYYANLFQQTRN